MAKEYWFDRLGEVLQLSDKAKYAAPVSAPVSTGVTFRQFGPYDAGNGNWQFSRGLRVEMPAGATTDSLFAMATGSVTYLPAADGGPGRVALSRADAMATAQVKQVGVLPAWYPVPKFIVYENVDPGDARAAILAVLQDPTVAEGVRKRIRKAIKDPKFDATPDELADRWLQSNVPDGVPVSGGTKIGACGVSTTAGKLEATVKMVDRLNPAPILFYNPSYHIALWDAQGWLDPHNKLVPKQTRHNGPVAGSGRILMVQKTGSGIPPFDTPATASPTIRPAIAAAATADTVLILDTETYAEELVITKPLTLMSTSVDDANDVNPLFPAIDGTNLNRPIRISNVTGGIAHVSHLFVLNGKAVDEKQKGAGGGILVERTHNAVISACVVSGCIAEGAGVFAEGYGGGIGSYHSSPAIVHCRIHDNKAGGRGSGIGAWGYGWPTIYRCVIKDNEPPFFTPRGNIRNDGGGIAITIASPNIEDFEVIRHTPLDALATRWDAGDLKRARRNWARILNSTIQENTSRDDGGGVFISIASNVRISNSDITGNKARNNGGGVRVSMRCELVIIGGQIAHNQSNFEQLLTTNSGGAGLASRNNTLVQLRDVRITDNLASGWAGGGVSFVSTDEGDFTTHWPPSPPFDPPPNFDWNNILLHPQIFNFSGGDLEIDTKTSIDFNGASMIDGQDGNHGKGGGLYVLRFKGRREAERLEPLIITGKPIKVHLEDVLSLAEDNVAAFPQSTRLYLDDQSISPDLIENDNNLLAIGEFSYPQA